MGAEPAKKRYLEDFWHQSSERPGPIGLIARLDPVARAAVVGDFKLGNFDVPNDVALLPLNDGVHCTLVDAVDAEAAGRIQWGARRYHEDLFSYVVARGNTLHRWLMRAARGDVLDHKNHLLLDNRRSNLRFASMLGNAWNSLRFKGIGYSSLFFGVSRVDDGWLTQIQNLGEKHVIGLFDDEVAAARAYDVKCLELRGEFAVLNFPEVL